VRQRIGKFRAEQKKKYEELGWALPEGTPAKAKAPATLKRKSSDGEGVDDVEGAEAETPVKAKKPRAKKGIAKKSNAKKSVKFEETVNDEASSDAKVSEGLVEEDIDTEV
jgi:hypothetical protein